VKPTKDTLEKYDANNRKAVMLIKLSIMDEMLLEVQTRDNAFPIWQTL
jgi:isocitrate dehydrogenase